MGGAAQRRPVLCRYPDMCTSVRVFPWACVGQSVSAPGASELLSSLLTLTISGMSVVGTGSPSLEWDGMGHGVNQHTSMHTGAHFHALHNTNALT